jgi:hypothetical protein
MTVLFPEPFNDRLVESLQANGHLAVTVGEHPTHETYQFKGRYVRHRPIVPEDFRSVTRARERFARAIRDAIPPGVPIEYVVNINLPDPTVAVEMDVHEVYLQTPGPAAGSRIHPSPDARA